MKAIGKTTKRTDGDVSFMLTAMFITESGKMTKLMVLEFTTTLMVPDMKGGGSKINNMARARRSGQIMLAMRVNIKTERSMVMASSCGLTGLLTRAISLTTISTDKVFTLGLMVVNMTVSGITIRCMALAFSLGMTVENTRENTLTIRSKDKAFLPGLMDVNTKGSGKTESSMA